jgi:hypothetical protein
MQGEALAAGMLVLLAVAHSALGERSILRPLFQQEWQVAEPRWAVERILRFAWHLTSVAWLALAAVALETEVLLVIATFSIVSAVMVFVMLRGHLAWPLFLLAGLAALDADQRLTDNVLTSAAIVASVILVLAAVIHVYWAFGGRWMLDVAVPTTPSGARAFQPGRLLTLAVAGALLAFAGLVMAAAVGTDRATVRTLVWIGVAVFALRAVGDTKTAGFTKSDHGSAFAQADDRWFTPIVVFVALGATASVLAE